MITIDGVQYRNLEEQVKKNKDDIAYILEEEGVLNQFGIKIVGEVDSTGDLPDPTTYEGEFGDAYAVGTTTPYTLYIFTRANGSHATNYWFNIGQFPLPGPVGPAGPIGDQGIPGLPALEFDGHRTTSTVPIIGTALGTSASNFNRTPVVGDYFLQIVLGLDGTSAEGRSWITNNEITSIGAGLYNFRVKSVIETTGAQGPVGAQGLIGPTGPVGAQGPIGPQGNPGQSFVIAGKVANEGQLPDPSTVADNIAYLVGTAAPYDLYVQLQDSSEWFNAGIVEGVQGPQGPQGIQGPEGPQGPRGPQGPAGSSGTFGEIIDTVDDNGSGIFRFQSDVAGLYCVMGYRNTNLSMHQMFLSVPDNDTQASATFNFGGGTSRFQAGDGEIIAIFDPTVTGGLQYATLYRIVTYT